LHEKYVYARKLLTQRRKALPRFKRLSLRLCAFAPLRLCVKHISP